MKRLCAILLSLMLGLEAIAEDNRPRTPSDPPPAKKRLRPLSRKARKQQQKQLSADVEKYAMAADGKEFILAPPEMSSIIVRSLTPLHSKDQSVKKIKSN